MDNYVNDNNNQVEGGRTLASLNLPQREGNKQFHCDAIPMDELVGKRFWIMDFQSVKTKYGEGRYLILIKYSLEDDESKAKKFFTACQEIKDTIDMVADRKAFPVQATLFKHKKSYWLK